MRLYSPRLACALLLALGAMLLATASASASTVCPAGPPTCDFATIQSAVNAAAPYDVIDVRTGEYDGAVIDKPLTLRGFFSGSDGRDPSRTPSAGPPESVVHGVAPNGIGFDVTSSHVTIDGFTFHNALPAVELRPTGSDYTVLNSIFIDNTFGIYANSDGKDPTLIRHNRFERN